MANLSIPPAYQRPLERLAGLPEDEATALAAKLEGLDAYAPVTDIERALDETVSGLAIALLALRGLLRTLSVSVDQIGQTLSESTDLNLDDAARVVLADRASALLETAAIGTTAIAVDLQTQHARNYQQARILTDIRPVFPDAIDEAPTGAVIVEVLQIQTWTRDGESETLVVALDEKDLTQLEQVVDRALKKTATLRRFLEKAELTYFQLEEEA